MMNRKFLFSLLAAVAIFSGVNECAAAAGHGKSAPVGMRKVWRAYDAFNEVYLDRGKYIYKSDSEVEAAVDRFNGAAAIWCQPIYWDMAMNAAALRRAPACTRVPRSLPPHIRG